MSHASVQRSIIPAEVLVKIEFGSFLLRHGGLFGLFLRFFMRLIFIFWLIGAIIIVIMLIFLFIVFLLVLLIIILIPDPEFLLNFLYQSCNLVFGYFIFLQDMRMFQVQLFGDFHWIWVENQSLKHYRVDFFLLVGLLILVVDSNDGRFVTHAETLIKIKHTQVYHVAFGHCESGTWL